MARFTDYAAVRQARFLTSRETGVYQFIADLLAEGRDQGRWTPLSSIYEAVREGEPSLTIEALRGYMDQMYEWGLVLKDNDHTGLRSLNDLSLGRTHYQLTAEATAALRFRDQILSPEGGALIEQRPRTILDGLLELEAWVRRHPVPDALSEEDLRDLTGISAGIRDTLAGMRDDADRFLPMVERHLQEMAGQVAVEEGLTHPLILFRGWFEQYMSTFIGSVQHLQNFGRACLTQLQNDEFVQPDGAHLSGSEVLLRSLARAEGLRPDLAEEDPMHSAMRVITRLEVLVSEEGSCRVLITRTHAALDRYLAAVKRIRIRTGAIHGTGRARLFSALAAKAAHRPESDALLLASVVIPDQIGGHMLDMLRFPHAKVGQDPWRQQPTWDLPMPIPKRGNPELRRSSPVKRAGEGAETRMLEHAARERREAEFWNRFLAGGQVDLEEVEVSLEEATWLMRRISVGMHSPERRFRLKDGRSVLITWARDPEDVSTIRVPEAGTSLRPRMAMKVVA